MGEKYDLSGWWGGGRGAGELVEVNNRS